MSGGGSEMDGGEEWEGGDLSNRTREVCEMSRGFGRVGDCSVEWDLVGGMGKRLVDGLVVGFRDCVSEGLVGGVSKGLTGGVSNGFVDKVPKGLIGWVGE